MERTILLVDDEENIASALIRLLRRDGYNILRANGGQQGLEILEKQKVGVIVSDQRMPGMTGTEFLSKVHDLYPDTIRIVLSGYTDLNSVTDAINRGAIYKFLTKPWEDDQLRAHVEEAFQLYEMKCENARLTQEITHANAALAALNSDLVQRVENKTREAGLNLHILRVAQEVLDYLPLAVIGIDEEGLIAVANQRAQIWFSAFPGNEAAISIPAELLRCDFGDHIAPLAQNFTLADGRQGRHWCYSMGNRSDARGGILLIELIQ